MQLRPTPRQLEVQASARTFADDVLRPRARELDLRGGFPHDSLRKAADLRLTAVNLPEALGGLEAGVVGYSLAVTEMARACASTTVALCVNNMVAEVVHKFGNDEQCSEHVPKLCDGTYRVGAFALSETGAGSDPGGMRTRARKTDKGWVINGSKLWITSGSDAGLFVVWARTSEAAGARGLSCFLVRGDTPGVSAGKPEHKMGLRGSTTTSVDFEDVEVGPEALLGDEEKGFRVAMMALDGGRIGIASQALGVGQAAQQAALDFAKARPELSQSQGVQWLLADSGTQLDAARLLALQAAWRKEQGLAFSREASMAKAYSSERAFSVCSRALDVMGEHGCTDLYEVERFYRDVRVTMIYEGTSEVQRIVVSRGIARRFSDQA